jgi:transcription-repair coupling factor (superfamily II helicase)
MLSPAVTERLARVARHPAVDESLDRLRRGSMQEAIAGLTDPCKALLVAIAASELRRPILWLVDTERRAEELLEPLRFFGRALGGAAAYAALLPALDELPGRGVGPHPEILETRATTLSRYVSGQVSVIVAPTAATTLSFADPGYYRGLSLSLTSDQDVSLEEVVAHLRRVGYVRSELVEMPGQFCARGGILDVFPPEAERPVRVELLGDTVESLREFDPDTQRSTGPVPRIALPPLTEFFSSFAAVSGNGADAPEGVSGSDTSAVSETSGFSTRTLFELRSETLVIVDEPEAIETAAKEARERFSEGAETPGEDGPGADGEPAFIPEQEWRDASQRCPRLVIERLPLQRDGQELRTLRVQPTTHYHGQIPAFLAEVRGRVAAGEMVLIGATTAGELERLADLCREYEVPYSVGEIEQSHAGSRLAEDATSGSAQAVTLVRAPLSEGFLIPEVHLAFYGASDLFEVLPVAAPRRERSKASAFTSDFSELKPGDYVVHVDHGIGEFVGLQTIESEGRSAEFMRLRYADDARLYVPLERLDLVQAYRVVEGAKPALDRLGGSAWATRKSRVRKSLTDMADKLLELYAERKAAPGFAFSPDTPWQREFEDAFEFTETADQAIAIADIKRDMERAAPMDRLLCGDVGYGKTEVAMRAAFKAVCDSKQVAVLAPTTILVFQHFETFRRRMAAFPVKIEMISRFRSAAEQKRIIAAVEEGKVDILIGTHRLLSKDVHFDNLGLLVVDEEQRFGVAHKERLKEMSRNVDVLTLTATPIPRTLNMSLAGLRDMSVIETPPKDRLAIQTVVAPFSEALLRRGVTEEIERGGQVFLLHNRIESIYSIADLVRKLVPKARVVVGHGQMGEHELERVMLQFIRDEADVLVCTTIIENGLDIPRANTLLVNRADRFGLSELYQLRGRVGRSNQRAYAYLMIPPTGGLTPLARRRLSALREFSDLGAGFRIAALDLELRGAGNLLGREQHGHIAAVGFDLYCQMLERAVSNKKGETATPELRATLNLGLDIRIPQEYIPGENLRLRTYKRIAGVTSDSEREAVRRELADRFGPLPPAVANLLHYAVLKSLCERLQISSVERHGGEVALKFHATTPVRPERFVELVRRQKGMRLAPSGVLTVTINQGAASIAETIRNLLLPLEAGR